MTRSVPSTERVRAAPPGQLVTEQVLDRAMHRLAQGHVDLVLEAVGGKDSPTYAVLRVTEALVDKLARMTHLMSDEPGLTEIRLHAEAHAWGGGVNEARYMVSNELCLRAGGKWNLRAQGPGISEWLETAEMSVERLCAAVSSAAFKHHDYTVPMTVRPVLVLHPSTDPARSKALESYYTEQFEDVALDAADDHLWAYDFGPEWKLAAQTVRMDARYGNGVRNQLTSACATVRLESTQVPPAPPACGVPALEGATQGAQAQATLAHFEVFFDRTGVVTAVNAVHQVTGQVVGEPRLAVAGMSSADGVRTAERPRG